MPNDDKGSRIYRLEFDPAFQSLTLANPMLLEMALLHFDSTSKADTWEPLDLIAVDADKPEPDFWKLAGLPTGFVCEEKVLYEIQTLENISEALPVLIGSRILYFVHTNERGCWDALDVSHCVWPSGAFGRGVPSYYAFLPHRLSFTTVMSVPETCGHELYVNSYCDDPAYEFKAEVEQQGLTGLLFREIWRQSQTTTEN